MKRIVLDPEVMTAATLSPFGASHRFLSRLGDGLFQPILTYPVLLDYDKSLRDPRHLVAARLTVDDVESLLDMWVRQSEVIRPNPSWRPVSDDLNRDFLIAAAVSGRADMLISLTPHLYQSVRSLSVAVVTPPAFWESLP